MIIVDTNVISELMRPLPEKRIIDWMDSQQSSQLAITSITKAEILYGIGILPEGKRKKQLATAAAGMFKSDFKGRIFPFDTQSAEHFAEIVMNREKLGRQISLADGQIAAICSAGKHTLATRNIKDFEDTGIALINPWKE